MIIYYRLIDFTANFRTIINSILLYPAAHILKQLLISCLLLGARFRSPEAWCVFFSKFLIIFLQKLLYFSAKSSNFIAKIIKISYKNRQHFLANIDRFSRENDQIFQKDCKMLVYRPLDFSAKIVRFSCKNRKFSCENRFFFFFLNCQIFLRNCQMFLQRPSDFLVKTVNFPVKISRFSLKNCQIFLRNCRMFL